MLLSALAFVGATLSAVAQDANNITIKGPNGLLSAVYHKPVGFIEGQKCPMVVLMHGLQGSKEDANLRQIATQLQQQGVATMLFDFNSHGSSEGEFKDLTLKKELKDAKAIVDYAKKLPFVKGLGVVGHSLGGVVAINTAEEYGKDVKALVLMAPTVSLREDAFRGSLFGKSFDPYDPPRSISISDTRALGRDFIKEAQENNILKSASKVKSETLVLIGKNDRTVPASYNEYLEMLMKDVKVEELKGLDHNFNSEDIEKHNKAITRIVEFLVKKLK